MSKVLNDTNLCMSDLLEHLGSFNHLNLLMPSPSASSKFGSSILKFFKHAQFFMYTQNHFGILKS